MKTTSKNLYLILKNITLYIICIVFLTSCSTKKTGFQKEEWGTVNGETAFLYTLTNKNGMTVKLTNYGGIITSVLAPDKNGVFEDVVLGFDNLQQYLDKNPCFGATIGRFANRIRNGQFEIGGVKYQLKQNDKVHCSHGANEFDRTLWDGAYVENKIGKGIKFHHFSKDGTNGFPGNLDVYVTYTLTKNNAIHVQFEATTDKSTHVNLTQHSYFNLTAMKENIYNHKIQIKADNYTEIDEDIVPTGKISTVKGTDWDLTKMTRIGDNIHKLNHNGYHYCYIFNKPLNSLEEVIKVIEPTSGRTLTVSTTQPGVQFYSGNSIGSFIGKKGLKYRPHDAFCLETEHLPDSPNHSNFPSTLLKPNEKYNEVVIYDFGVVE